MKDMENLVNEVGNLCLMRAKEILESEQISTAATLTEAVRAAEIIGTLIRSVYFLDDLNLR